MVDTVLRLTCSIQTYKWGKKGSDSMVAQLGQNASHQFEAKADETYAELWMGCHPSGPSYLWGTKTLLADHLKQNPELIYGSSQQVRDDAIDSRYVNSLPFLFKVLSVNTALSIQAHPDLKLAKRLHSERPQSYKDGNHKPEMAIALPQPEGAQSYKYFQALCGFRPLEEIAIYLETYQDCVAEVFGGNQVVDEFIAYVRDLGTIKRRASLSSKSEAQGGLNQTQQYDEKDIARNNDNDKQVLKKLFECLMKADRQQVIGAIRSILDKIASQKGAEFSRGSIEALIPLLNSQYPDDVGVLAPFLLNYVELDPNAADALFLGPNEPHAYLHGDIMECMASSDNVVRAGLTPKERDVDTLVEMLTYESVASKDVPFSGIPVKDELHPRGLDGTHLSVCDHQKVDADAAVSLYTVPVDEFKIAKIVLSNSSCPHTTFGAINGPSILIVIKGDGEMKVQHGAASQQAFESSDEMVSAVEKSFPLHQGYVYFIGADTKILLQKAKDCDTLLAYKAFCNMSDFMK
ncbi:hypothetical protein MP228_005274 [Amoeboaphelidium protococcarum]|nr:hypothetical protein MP228_005274 [Amoeboaphelidium protococcarum]